MEIIILILATLSVPLALVIVYCIMTIGIFICEEINHETKKVKRELKEAWWQIEWQLKHH